MKYEFKKDMTLEEFIVYNNIDYTKLEGISSGTIYNIIRGSHYNKTDVKYQPTRKTLLKLKKALGIELEEVKDLISNQLLYNNKK